MDHTTRGTTLTVHLSHEASTVRVSHTNDNSTEATLTITEAHELGPLLATVLNLNRDNPPAETNEPHPFTTA